MCVRTLVAQRVLVQAFSAKLSIFWVLFDASSGNPVAVQ